MNQFYVYIYLNPCKPGFYHYEDVCFLYEPMYVGKGQKERYLSHLKYLNKNVNRHLKNKLSKILKGGVPKQDIQNHIVFLRCKLPEIEALNLEIQLIEQIGRAIFKAGPLCNLAEGGRGSAGHKKPHALLKLQKKKFSDIKGSFEEENYTLLSKEVQYKNNNTKLEYICPRGHKGLVDWMHFRNGGRCPLCFKENQKKDFAIIEDSFKAKGCILLTKKEEYKNGRSKLNYICSKGHKAVTIWNSFRRGHDGCVTCFADNVRQRKSKEPPRKLTEQDINRINILLKETTQKEIAKRFDVSPGTISNIKYRRCQVYKEKE